MKKIITAAAVLLFVSACKEDITLTRAVSFTNKNIPSSVPAALLNPADESWKVSPADTTCYIPMDKASHQAQKEERKLVTIQFDANENCRLIYKLKDDATLQLQGKVSFRKRYGKDIFVLQPLSGIRTSKGKQSTLTSRELIDGYSTTYLWEKISFADLPRDNFLLLVDLDAHPMAGAAKAGMVEKSWVVKFYSR